MRLLHYSKEPLEKLYSIPLDRQGLEGGMFKPRGLWVSVEGKDDWLEWCKAENFGLASMRFVTEIRVRGDDILRLSCAAEIDALTRKYGHEQWPGKSYSRLAVYWPDVAQDYAGIIIAPYIWSRRLGGGSPWYYSWDCASGCIWDANAMEIAMPSRPIVVERDAA